MAYENGWKDGWSSADHATESYSPYAAERARREADSGIRSNEDERKNWQPDFLREAKEKAEKREAENEKWMEDFNRRLEIRDKAQKYMMEERRNEYTPHTSFQKATAKLGLLNYGKLSEKRAQIEKEIQENLNSMSDDQLESYVDQIEERTR